MTPLGRRLRALRRGRGWSMRKLAVAAGCTVKQLGDYELNGMIPRMQTIVKLAKALGCSLDYLCGLTDENGRPL